MTRNLILLILLLSFNASAAVFQYGGIKHDITSQGSSGAAIILNSASTQVQRITGNGSNTIKMPNATTLRSGYWYTLINESSSPLTVQTSDGTGILTLSGGSQATTVAATLYLTSTSTSGGPWTIGSTSTTGAGGAGGGSGSGTSWTSFSMNITSTGASPTRGTGVNEKAYYRCADSQDMLIHWDYTQTGAGTNGGGTYLFEIPNSKSIDTNVILTSTSNTEPGSLGSGAAYNDSICHVKAYDSTHLMLACAGAGSLFTVSSTAAALSGSARYSFFARAPISGGCN